MIKDIAAFVVSLALVVCIIGMIVDLTVESSYGYRLDELGTLKSQCEELLPRNKECKINPEFVIVDKEKY